MKAPLKGAPTRGIAALTSRPFFEVTRPRVSVLRGRRGEGNEIGPCQAPLLASCSWLGWLFSHVLAHGPVAESGPQALAHVDDRSTAASLCPVCCACSRCSEAVRHVRQSSCRQGGVVAPEGGGEPGGRHLLSGEGLVQAGPRFTSARFNLRFVRRRVWCGCVESSRKLISPKVRYYLQVRY